MKRSIVCVWNKVSRVVTAVCLAAAASIVIGHSAYAADSKVETATFAGGCFWCTESDFDKVEGVLETVSGYTGGPEENPDYRQVSAGKTGHTEGVQIKFDPSVVSYERLLEIYWRSIDPTTDDRQFCDTGKQYRPEIFVHTPAQRLAADASKAKIIETKPFKDSIKVPVTDASTFWPAEDYHQDYHNTNPLRYKFYRKSCGRDKRLEELWGAS